MDIVEVSEPVKLNRMCKYQNKQKGVMYHSLQVSQTRRLFLVSSIHRVVQRCLLSTKRIENMSVKLDSLSVVRNLKVCPDSTMDPPTASKLLTLGGAVGACPVWAYGIP